MICCVFYLSCFANKTHMNVKYLCARFEFHVLSRYKFLLFLACRHCISVGRAFSRGPLYLYVERPVYTQDIMSVLLSNEPAGSLIVGGSNLTLFPQLTKGF